MTFLKISHYILAQNIISGLRSAIHQKPTSVKPYSGFHFFIGLPPEQLYLDITLDKPPYK